MPKCVNCDGEEFELNDGLYYCVECHVQSQDLREVVLDDVVEEGGPRLFSQSNVRTIRSPRIKRHRQNSVSTDVADEWSLYELYNIIIKKQVDALISLGANPKLKDAVFDLWTCYLKKSNVAFLNSSKSRRLPKFHFPLGTCRRREAEIVLGDTVLSKRRHSDKRKKYSEKRRKKATSLAYQKYGYMRKAKKKLKKSEAASSDRGDDTASACSDSEFGYISESSIASTMSVASSSRSEPVKKKKTRISACLSVIGKSFEQKGRKAMSYSAGHNIWHMKLSRTLSFLYLGLLLINDQILLCDIIRWARQGKIPLYKVSQLFPDNVNCKSYEKSLFQLKTPVTAKVVKNDCDELARNLDVPHVFGRHMQLICARLVTDLNLPNEICALANIFISSYETAKEKKGKKKCLPYYEAQAMAVLIVCLKLMFGLNGNSENKLSELAKYINSERADCECFVWNDWVTFAKLRQCIAKFSIYNCNESHEKLGFDVLLGKYYAHEVSQSKLTQSEDQFSEKHLKKIQKSLLSSMASIINHTSEKDAICASSFPASFEVCQVLQKWSEIPAVEDRSSGDLNRLMSADFSQSRLDYILHNSDEAMLKLTAQFQKSCEVDLAKFPYKHYKFNLCKFRYPLYSNFLEDDCLHSLSYRWLISVCSNLLEMACADLYHEIQLAETYISGLLNERE